MRSSTVAAALASRCIAFDLRSAGAVKSESFGEAAFVVAIEPN
jgi:hypothetical protein